MIAGAALAYFGDPVRGRARRARIRDAGVHARRVVDELMFDAAVDARNRLHGIHAELSSESPDRMQRVKTSLRHLARWNATMRGAALALGTGMALLGLARRSAFGKLQTLAGLALAARGGMDVPFRELPRSTLDHVRTVLKETPGGAFPGHVRGGERRAQEQVREADVIR